MAKEVLTVRDVDEEVWRRFRAKTEEEGLKTGQAVNEALAAWVRQKDRLKRPDPRRILKVKGLVRTAAPVAWSEEVDETLYGRRP
jgi:hypothetical protein